MAPPSTLPNVHYYPADYKSQLLNSELSSPLLSSNCASLGSEKALSHRHPRPLPPPPSRPPSAVRLFVSGVVVAVLLSVAVFCRDSTLSPFHPSPPPDPMSLSELASAAQSCILSSSPSASFLLPSDPLFPASAAGNNARYRDVLPLLLVNVTSTLDLQASVKCASSLSLPLSVMCGGHSFEGGSQTSSSVLLQLDSYSSVLSTVLPPFDRDGTPEESPPVPTVTFQSGVRLGRLYGHVASLPPSPSGGQYVVGGGTCPTVGSAGHILCGGFGMLGRHVGLTSDQVLEMTVVTAGGEVVRASEEENEELFWAMRGACSSGFGVIDTITMKLTEVPTRRFTFLQTPTTADYETVGNNFAFFWQSWASLAAPREFTSTLHFDSVGVNPDGLYIGDKASALSALDATGFLEALSAAFPSEDVTTFFTETDFLGAASWFTGGDLTTVQDFFAVTSLPPLDDRRSARKAKSAEVYSPLSLEGIAAITALRASGPEQVLNQIEWKAYGGVNAVGGGVYTDGRSPLQRGHLFEMHYGNSYSYNDDMTSEEKAANDEKLLDAINTAGAKVNAIVGSSKGYVGYIDFEIPQPGSDYFGLDNSKRLTALRRQLDPRGVLSSRAANFLYPMAPATFGTIVFVGAFDDAIAALRLDEKTGSLEYLQSTKTPARNPAWLVTSPEVMPQRTAGASSIPSLFSAYKFLYAALEVSDYPQEDGAASGAIAAYRALADGSLDLVNCEGTLGPTPNFALLHKWRDEDNYFIYATNSKGSVSVMPVDDASGAVKPPTQVLSLDDGVTPVFLHQITMYDRHALVIDRNGDSIHFFSVDPSTGLLLPPFDAKFILGEGTGPRHLVYHPRFRGVAYLVSEFASTITTLQLREELRGGLSISVLDVQSSLRDSESTTDMAGGEVAVSEDGRFLYISNRDNSSPNLGRSSIAVFKVAQRFKSDGRFPGHLKLLQHVSSGGAHPRHFAIVKAPMLPQLQDPEAEKSLIVIANKDSNNIVAYRIDVKTGLIDENTVVTTDTLTFAQIEQPIQIVLNR